MSGASSSPSSRPVSLGLRSSHFLSWACHSVLTEWLRTSHVFLGLNCLIPHVGKQDQISDIPQAPVLAIYSTQTLRVALFDYLPNIIWEHCFSTFFFHYQPPKGSFQTFFLFLIATLPPLCNLHPVSPMVITYLITVPNSNYSSNQKIEQWSNLCGDAKKHTNFKMLADSTFSICQTLTSKKQLSLVSAPAPL